MADASQDCRGDIKALMGRHVPGTRDWLLRRFDSWLSGDDTMTNLQHRAFVLVAGPGFGKSAFSALLCSLRPESIAAHHFCRWGEPNRSSPHRLLCSLAYQLACHLPAARDAFKSAARSLDRQLKSDGLKVTDKPLRTLFDDLLTGVLHTLGDAMPDKQARGNVTTRV